MFRILKPTQFYTSHGTKHLIFCPVDVRGVIVSSRYRAKFELEIKKLDQTFFFSDVRNSTRKIVEPLELNLIKFESIKKLINNYTRTRLDSSST